MTSGTQDNREDTGETCSKERVANDGDNRMRNQKSHPQSSCCKQTAPSCEDRRPPHSRQVISNKTTKSHHEGKGRKSSCRQPYIGMQRSLQVHRAPVCNGSLSQERTE